MILAPTTPPFAISFALAISFFMARKFASNGFFEKSGSRKPICAVEITPIPPSLATLPARLERLIPTPIPPCITGIFNFKSPISNGFIMFSPF